MTNSFGGQGYVKQETRALSSIAETPGLDTTSGQEAFVKLLQTHDAQIKFLAQQVKQTQTGVDEANQNPIQQIEQFIADIIVLLGGGQLAEGALDFGDLQYILPALGALFGFGDGPFPISLFEAAQKFFLGYVVPQQQFVDVINGMITAWAGVFGIDPKFVKDVKALLTAVGDLFDGVGNLLPSLNELFSALGITGADLGPLGQALGPIIRLFSSLDLTKFGSIIEFITDAIDPFIVQLTAVINFINSVLAVLGFDGDGGVVNSPIEVLIQPFVNLLKFLGNINLAGANFNPIAAARQFIENILNPTGLLATIENLLNGGQPINVANLFGFLRAELLSVVPAGALSTAAPNRISNGTFTADAIAAGSEWSVDMTSSRSDDGTGSARVVADGRPHAIRTGDGSPDEKISVGAGQHLPISMWVGHEGAVAAGGSPAVLLQVYRFAGPIAIIGPVTVDSYSPATTDLPWPGHKMSGTYVVEADVTHIQVRVCVTEQAIQGVYRFDDGGATQATDYSVIPGLAPVLKGLNDNWQATLDQLASVARGFPVVGATLAQVVEAFANFNPFNIAGSLGAINIAGDFQALLRHLVGGLRGRPVADDEDVSVADLYNAANQATGTVTGVDEFKHVQTSGSTVIPSFAAWTDVVGCGKGQDGQTAPVIPGFCGDGGAAGKVNATTWQDGVDYTAGTTVLTWTINSNGSITFTIPGRTLTALAGSGAQIPQPLGGWTGRGPGVYPYNGHNYVFGGDQAVQAAPGAGPGGGGGGSTAFFIPGGKGGPAVGAMRFRANNVPNPSTGADTTPPSEATPVFISATNSTVTIAATGSVDA